jgi:hypothetical protein
MNEEQLQKTMVHSCISRDVGDVQHKVTRLMNAETTVTNGSKGGNFHNSSIFLLPTALD